MAIMPIYDFIRFNWVNTFPNHYFSKSITENCMEDQIITYIAPDQENHSFYFVDFAIPTHIEPKMHRHSEWEVLYVIHGSGKRTAGDTIQSFKAGDVTLIPPLMIHRWDFDPNYVDENGNIRYLAVGYSQDFIDRCRNGFPEMRNQLIDVTLPENAINFGPKAAKIIQERLLRMREMTGLERLCEMLQLLPEIYCAFDHTFAGKAVRVEKNVQRMQKICTYVIHHHAQPITLEEIAAEADMNPAAFCAWFRRCKGMTFSRYLMQYRLETACELLQNTEKQISEICYMVGYNNLPHFVRLFKKFYGNSPSQYRKKALNALAAGLYGIRTDD